MTTKTKIVRIGNSGGIRVPELLLEHAALSDDVELRAEPGRLVVTGSPRSGGWAARARAMHRRGHDTPLDQDTATRFERTEWRW